MGRHYVGLDVSLEMTSVCVLDEAGSIVWRGKVGSTPEALATAIRARAPEVARIGLETGPLCTGVTPSSWTGVAEEIGRRLSGPRGTRAWPGTEP